MVCNRGMAVYRCLQTTFCALSKRQVPYCCSGDIGGATSWQYRAAGLDGPVATMPLRYHAGRGRVGTGGGSYTVRAIVWKDLVMRLEKLS